MAYIVMACMSLPSCYSYGLYSYGQRGRVLGVGALRPVLLVGGTAMALERNQTSAGARPMPTEDGRTDERGGREGGRTDGRALVDGH